jgi:uncharacterized membrane protein YkoI
MQNRITRGFLALTMAFALTAVAQANEGQKGEKDTDESVTLADLPAAARTVVEQRIGKDHIKKLDKENEGGKVVYDVEGTLNGKDVEITVSADGNVLSSEEEVAYDSLPSAVRAAAEKYFSSVTGLEAAKEIEAGKTAYEVEGKKDGGKVTLKLDETGKVLEEEKQHKNGKHDEKD